MTTRIFPDKRFAEEALFLVRLIYALTKRDGRTPKTKQILRYAPLTPYRYRRVRNFVAERKPPRSAEPGLLWHSINGHVGLTWVGTLVAEMHPRLDLKSAFRAAECVRDNRTLMKRRRFRGSYGLII